MSEKKLPSRPRRLTGIAMIAGALALGACSMDVDNPTMIQDEDLNTVASIEALAAGVAGDFAEAMIVPGGGGLITAGAMLTDELVHVGTWIGLRGLSDGFSQDDWVESQSRWAEPSQARWVAEDAIERLGQVFAENDIDPNSRPEIPSVTMWAGFANKALGDHFCEAVIDGGPSMAHTEFYERAETHFTNAIQLAGAAGESDIQLAAYAGRAHTRMQLGDWAGAVSDAAKISTDWVYWMYFNQTAGVSNDMYWWGYLRDETSVWGTPFMTLGENLTTPNGGDPRVQFDVAMTAGGEVQDGGDGRRPFYRQRKFRSYNDEIALTKGTEMRLIEAEAALQSGDVTTAVAKINAVRAYHNANGKNLPLVSASNVEQAWTLLMAERGIELWLEGKRLADLRRWAKSRSGNVPFSVVREEARGQPASADPIRPVLETDVYQTRGDICIQISKDEKASNKNIS
ncbi:MAG: hypothetical protein AMXMBFR53_12530 [Gemmatimonadota bacterium]